MAWLHAAPTVKGSKAKPVSRIEALGGKPPPLPPIAFGDHLVGYLMEVGPVSSNGMGTVPVSFAELRAWQAVCEHSMSAWDFQTLHAMSVAYMRECGTADSPNAPPPWIAPLDDDKRLRVAQHIRNVLRD